MTRVLIHSDGSFRTTSAQIIKLANFAYTPDGIEPEPVVTTQKSVSRVKYPLCLGDPGNGISVTKTCRREKQLRSCRSKRGSERQFDGAPILRSFLHLLKFNEFGIGHGHAFGLRSEEHTSELQSLRHL